MKFYDDASDIPAEDYISCRFPVKVIRGKVNRGPSCGRNVLLHASKSDYIHFQDADDLFLPGWTLRVREVIRETGADLVITEISSCRNGQRVCEKVLGLERLLAGRDLVCFALQGSILTPASVCRRRAALVHPAINSRRPLPTRKPAENFMSGVLAEAAARAGSVLFKLGAHEEARQAFAQAKALGPPRFLDQQPLYRWLAKTLGPEVAERLGILYRAALPEKNSTLRSSMKLTIGVLITYHNKPLCVWNCPLKEEVSPPRLLHAGDGLQILYHGSLVPQRLPLSVLYAIALLPPTIRLRVIGYETIGYEGYANRLKEVASQLGISQRIEILGPLPRREVLRVSQRCDVGPALLPIDSSDINFRCMVGASNKPFDYLASGSALLISDLPDWKEMYVEPGYGLACDPEDPDSIARALRWFF